MSKLKRVMEVKTLTFIRLYSSFEDGEWGISKLQQCLILPSKMHVKTLIFIKIDYSLEDGLDCAFR